jgi:hypothetical protein
VAFQISTRARGLALIKMETKRDERLRRAEVAL